MSSITIHPLILELLEAPEVEAMKGVEQNPTHHDRDVWGHTMAVVENALAATDDLAILVAAVLHDIGKPATTRLRDGRIIAHGHEHVGADMVPRILARYGREDLVAQVEPLVRQHMRLAREENPSRKAVARLIAALGDATIGQWAILVTADQNGRPPYGGYNCRPVTRVARQLINEGKERRGDKTDL